MRALRGRLGPVTICAVAAAVALSAAGPAQAASDVYPSKGGTFENGSQGWLTTDSSCSPGLLCTASGGYDGSDGDPPGSYAANTTIVLNAAGLLKSTVTVQSPDFTVSEAGDATLHLDRQFVPGALVDLTAQASYTAELIDRTSGRRTKAIEESVSGASPFTGRDAAVSVKAGDSYAISITAEVSSSLAGTSLLGRTTSFRFDNVALSVQGSGTGKGEGGKGGDGGSLTDQRLQSLIAAGSGGLVGPAVLKSGKLFVKARCPRKVGHACRVMLQGLLTKRKTATVVRRAKVRKAKAKQLRLKVKPQALGKVKGRKKLLFKVTVRAGTAHATAFKRLKLLRR